MAQARHQSIRAGKREKRPGTFARTAFAALAGAMDAGSSLGGPTYLFPGGTFLMISGLDGLAARSGGGCAGDPDRGWVVRVGAGFVREFLADWD